METENDLVEIRLKRPKFCIQKLDLGIVGQRLRDLVPFILPGLDRFDSWRGPWTDNLNDQC